MAKRSIGALIAKNFVGATRQEMDDAYQQKFKRPATGMDDEAIRLALQAAYTEAPATAEHPQANHDSPPRILPAAVPAARSKIPQLNPTGRWDGRMRRVTFHKRSGSPNQQCESVGWNGVIWNILLGVPVDMPWPYYLAALNTKLKDEGSEAVSEWVKQPDKRLLKVVTPAYHDTINMSDHGDVPGTEDLPLDYVDYFQREARRSNMFKKHNRAALVMIHNILHEQYPMAYFRDMSDEDIRMAIADRLGTEFVQMLQGEFYEETA